MKNASFVVSYSKNSIQPSPNSSRGFRLQSLSLLLVRPLVFLILILNYVSAQAADFTHEKCKYALTNSGDVQIGRQWLENDSRCYLDIHPMDVTDMTYRDYLFINDGGLMVFNAYGDGPVATHTGARMYYFFPRTQDYPDYAIEPNGDVVIQMVSGHLIQFEMQTMAVNGSTDLTFVEDKKVIPTNHGGLELKPTKGIILDLGFTLGKGPNENPDREVVFKDSSGEQCKIKNKEVFKYETDVIFKFSDKELQVFLKKRCPKINFSLTK